MGHSRYAIIVYFQWKKAKKTKISTKRHKLMMKEMYLLMVISLGNLENFAQPQINKPVVIEAVKFLFF